MAARRCVHHGATRPRCRNVHTSTFSVRCSVALLATHNRCQLLAPSRHPVRRDASAFDPFRKLFTRIANRAFHKGKGPHASLAVVCSELDLIAAHCSSRGTLLGVKADMTQTGPLCRLMTQSGYHALEYPLYNAAEKLGFMRVGQADVKL